MRATRGQAWRWRIRIAFVTLAGLTASGAMSSVAPANADAGEWVTWTSSPSNASARLVERPASTELTSTLDLNVSSEQPLQTWRGVGAALTDASAGILSTNSAATSLLFAPTQADGAQLNLVRLPLSATDFSTTSWAHGWNDTTQTLTPPAIASTNAAFVANTLRTLRSDLKVIAAPWSAPAAMKDSATLNGGSLKESSLAAYGRMLVAQERWLRTQGVPLAAMSLGNEPFHSAAGLNGYPTMLMSDDQMIRLANQIGPPFRADGVELWSIDHNWDHRSHYDTVQAGAPSAFSAAAFHCYGGNPTHMLDVQPPPIVTECTGTNDGFDGTFRWDAENLIVGAIRAGSTGLLMWNLALNQNHGPHTGGCSTCRGVIDVHSATGAITKNPEFYALAHLSRAADPRSIVVSTGFTAGVPFVAFKNPNDEIGIVGHNNTGATQNLGIVLNGKSQGRVAHVEPGELFTIRGSSSPPTCHGSAVTVDLQAGESPTQGDDVILGTAGAETINALGGNDYVCAGSGDDTLIGGLGKDRIWGEADADVIFGGKGSDSLAGGAGDDQIGPGRGNDSVAGNEGVDLLSFADFDLEAAVTVDLARTNAQATGAGAKTLRDRFERLEGGKYNDQLYGTAYRDSIEGLDGKDLIVGRSGDDHIRGGDGNDNIKGGGGIDDCDGGYGLDALTNCEPK